MTVMDKQLKQEIAREVAQINEKVMREHFEMYNEVWLPTNKFLERFGMFTKDWLKEYGKYIPRQRMEVKDRESGTIRTSRYAYPQHLIERLIAEGKLQTLLI